MVNDRTHTLYVANNFNSDAPGTRSVINTATCNGTTPLAAAGTSPPGDRPGTVCGRAGRSQRLVYVTDFAGAAVTILNGARCNAEVTTGCGAATERAVGSVPFGLALDQRTRTVYVTKLFHGWLAVHRQSRLDTTRPTCGPARIRRGAARMESEVNT